MFIIRNKIILQKYDDELRVLIYTLIATNNYLLL